MKNIFISDCENINDSFDFFEYQNICYYLFNKRMKNLKEWRKFCSDRNLKISIFVHDNLFEILNQILDDLEELHDQGLQKTYAVGNFSLDFFLIFLQKLFSNSFSSKKFKKN